MEMEEIVKSIVYEGSQKVHFQPETKVTLHFQTRLANEDHTLIDDSRKWNKPMQLILGRQFKLPIWEALVRTMNLGEVAKFVVHKSMVEAYPLISRVCRDEAQHKKSTHVHHCHGSMVAAGLGYDDLNKLFKEPQDLEFIFELIKVEQPDEYEKEPWQMDTEQKLKLIPKLKEKGNILYQNKKYEKAIEKYDLALTFIDQLQLREKPRDTEWNHLNSMKLPFHLNIAQCKLCLNDFYAAIEHCNSVLQNDRDNIKALFRRGKAHMNVWNIQEAREDLKRVLQLDATQKSVVLPLLNNLKEIERKGKDVEKAMMAKSLF